MLFFIFAPILLTVLTAFVILISPWWSLKIDFNKKKFTIFLIATLVITGAVSWGTFFLADKSQMYNEVWHFNVISVKHEKQWTERQSYTTTKTDSKGNVTFKTEYRTVKKGPFWKAQLEDGDWRVISQGDYDMWKNVWKNEKKTGMHKGSSAGFFGEIDGDILECEWLGTFETMYPWAEIHKYRNKVRRSKSVLKFKKPSKKMMAQYPRPADNNNTKPIISYSVKVKAGDELYMRRINADIGRKREIHVLFILFLNAPRDVVSDVLSAWQGTNKNELAIFASVDKEGSVQWTDVESWMDNTTYHGMIEDEMNNKPLDLKRMGKYIMKTVGKNWKRKEFKDFDYLKTNILWYFYLIDIVVVAVFCIISGMIINTIKS